MSTTQTGLPKLPPITEWTLGDLPAVGTEWPGMGGIFAGLVRGQNGGPDYLLILGPEADRELEWQQAMDWASAVRDQGHSDYALPTRSEQAVLYGNTRDQFKREWYWSCEQLAESADYAWLQDFGNGNQYCSH